MRTSNVILAIVLVVGGQAAFAGDRVLGYGSETCSTWLQGDTDKISKVGLLSWLHGYVTAVNFSFKEAEIKRGADIAAMVDGYCKANPSKRMVSVGTFLAGSLLENTSMPQSQKN